MTIPIDEMVDKMVKNHLQMLPKPLPNILDEIDGNIQAAIDAAQKAVEAGIMAKQAADAASKASNEAGRRAEEFVRAGEKAADTAIAAATKAAIRAERASNKAIKAGEEVLKRIESLEKRLNSLEEAVPVEAVVVLREISKENAKTEIVRLFKEGKVLYYSDIARKLCLDLEMVVNICEELQKQGEIAIDAGIS